MSEVREPPLKRRRDFYEDDPGLRKPQLTPRQQLMPPPPRPPCPTFSHGGDERLPEFSSLEASCADPCKISRIESGAALLNGDSHLSDEIPEKQGNGSFNTLSNGVVEHAFAPAISHAQPGIYKKPVAVSTSEVKPFGRDARSVDLRHWPSAHQLHQERWEAKNTLAHHEKQSSAEESLQPELYSSQFAISPSVDQSIDHEGFLEDSRIRHRIPLAQYTDSDTNARAQPPISDPRHGFNHRDDLVPCRPSPQKSSHLVRQVHTPLPQKKDHRGYEDRQSITSPFYNPSSSQRYPDRMTLPDRSDSRSDTFRQTQLRTTAMRSPQLPLNRASGMRRNAAQSFSSPSRRYPPTVPSNKYMMPTPSRQLLAPGTPRDAEGLFRRPKDARPTSRYFSRQCPESNMDGPVSVRANRFSNQTVPQLLPSTPSVVRNRPPFPPSTNRAAGLDRFQYSDSPAGLRSGKSKPSTEFSRSTSIMSSNNAMAHGALGGLGSSMGLRRTARR